ncbi:MAG: RNA-binding protein [Ignavibacteriales bacterium]|nr:RNA-binding protein [Ignavibacteriaceae bacterium]NLH60515.1 RNA-binding protein [Ignavibacteriales bacterium]HOJ16993.1 RNA-binding protein [Ignavibacteriaceae bacterium]HPO55163.1 RNA-binding protein [Ignavibacteriaceae bacterium]
MSTKLFVGSLPWSTNDAELKTAFEPYGKVVSAKVITDRQTKKSRGFGFVEMEEKAEADKAIEGMNGKNFKGRNLIVNEAKPREE